MFLLPGGSEQAVIDAINAANANLPTPLTVDDLYFGKVKQLATGGLVSVPAVTVHSSRFEGYLRFEYNRLDIGKAYQGIKPKVRRVGYPTLYRLLPIINETLGLSLTEHDVVDVSITWLNDDEQVNIPIVTKVDSLGFEGQFVVEYTRVRPDLASLAFTTLDVLKHPIDPTLGKKSLAMSMWSLDFSAEFASGVFGLYMGRWSSISRVQATMAAHGFPDWPDVPYLSLDVKPTGQVPTANQEFGYVIIQKDIDLADYSGDGYIHFNLQPPTLNEVS